MKFLMPLNLSLLLLLSACASGPTIISNVSPDHDFRNFQSYDFIEPLGTDRANGIRTPFSNRLMTAIDAEMRSRGLTRSDSADLLVDFTISAVDRVDIRTTPHHSVHRSHWNRGFSTWPTYSTTVRQYTEGSLIIDLIDPRQNRLIAEGAATSRISDTNFNQDQINDVVAQVMASIWAN